MVGSTQTNYEDFKTAMAKWGKAGLLDPACDPRNPTVLPDTIQEASKQAHRLLLNLIEVAQRPPEAAYQAEFKGHWQPGPYRPKPPQ